MIETVEQIRERVAEILNVAPENIDPSKPLSRLGMDSLAMVQLTATIENKLGYEWMDHASPEALTIRSLAGLLLQEGRQRNSGTQTCRDLMRADSVLPHDIRPQYPRVAEPQQILVTGATGFLGAHLLACLMHETQADVVCLIRPGRVEGLERVEKQMRGCGVWSDGFSNRICAMHADLTQPRLGLSPVEFNALAYRIDAIFHSAASVNWVQPYSALRASNVYPLRELLRLACQSKAKPFHFVSTLGVCFSSDGPGEIDEDGDAFRDLDGIPLAYAQSKLVAETLVRSVGQRGLPATIFRPTFLSGDSRRGVSNTSDFISALIKGCIQMSAAPDLDWQLDAIPVDFAAKAMVRLAIGRHNAEDVRVFHLANPRPRHWRELVLWMNLYGYHVELAPYEEWLARFRSVDSADFSLRNLAPFFERRLPRRYEESIKRRVRHEATSAVLFENGLECPALSASLIDRYFTGFIGAGFLAAPARRRVRAHQTPNVPEIVKMIFGAQNVESISSIELDAAHGVISELTSWSEQGTVGLHGYRVKPHSEEPFNVVVKVKAMGDTTIEIGETVARLCGRGPGDAYARFSSCLGLSGASAREIGIYREAPDQLRRFLPRFYGGWQDDSRVVLVLEHLSDMNLMNAVDCIRDWTSQRVEAVIDGLAEIHAVWYGRERELLQQNWIGAYSTADRLREAQPLWISLAEHASATFAPWLEGVVCPFDLIAKIGDSWNLIEKLPRTLIHNDFNPRNIALRGGRPGDLQLCAYDWELATLGLPQHDLAEFLCFVLGPQHTASDLHGYVERHRQKLGFFSGRLIDQKTWQTGFVLSLEDLMINRLPAYTLIHRFQRQPFLERIVRCWARIYRMAAP